VQHQETEPKTKRNEKRIFFRQVIVNGMIIVFLHNQGVDHLKYEALMLFEDAVVTHLLG
jgi:hypothetical protein